MAVGGMNTMSRSCQCKRIDLVTWTKIMILNGREVVVLIRRSDSFTKYVALYEWIDWTTEADSKIPSNMPQAPFFLTCEEFVLSVHFSSRAHLQ